MSARTMVTLPGMVRYEKRVRPCADNGDWGNWLEYTTNIAP
jgi:hypothetical protein